LEVEVFDASLAGEESFCEHFKAVFKGNHLLHPAFELPQRIGRWSRTKTILS